MRRARGRRWASVLIGTMTAACVRSDMHPPAARAAAELVVDLDAACARGGRDAVDVLHHDVDLTLMLAPASLTARGPWPW